METQLNLFKIQSPLLAEVQLTYKNKQKPYERTKISNSEDIADYLRVLYKDEVEHVEYFYLIMLNRANQVLGWNMISKGGVAGTVADPKVIFQAALLSNASAIILAHNHPSGNPSPSQQDKNLTNKIYEAAKFFDIAVLDHVILTSETYYSFADEGELCF